MSRGPGILGSKSLPRNPQMRSKAKEKCHRQSKGSGMEHLKTVVCRLPLNLPEQIFWQSVQMWVMDKTIV